MKTLKLPILLLIAASSYAYGNSHTFFSPRQITTDATFELALTDYDIYHGDDESDFKLSIKPFYQQSNRGQLSAQFFLPNNASCVAVREDGTGDIDPLWFDVIGPSGTQYSSTLAFSPTRITYGGVLTFYANLDRWIDGLWLLVNTAIISANHNMHVNETNINTTGTIPGFPNMCGGFNDPDWCAGKIQCCGALNKGGLDDIQLKVGYDIDFPCMNHISPYGVLTIPTGNRPTSHYLFEPLVGSKHVTLGFGLNTDYALWEQENNSLRILADVKYRYSLRACERRSFDLCANGDWSRYLLVVDQAELGYSLPLINLATFQVNVTPGSTVDGWLAMHHHGAHFDVELGYNLWWRQQENIALRCPGAAATALGAFGIYDLTAIGIGAIPTTASTATIAQAITSNQATSDATFTPLALNQINYCSAAHPSAMSNKIYLAIAKSYECRAIAGLFGIGASYEIARPQAAFNQWAIWADVGLNF